jgi:hypothetical protein
MGFLFLVLYYVFLPFPMNICRSGARATDIEFLAVALGTEIILSFSTVNIEVRSRQNEFKHGEFGALWIYKI